MVQKTETTPNTKRIASLNVNYKKYVETLTIIIPTGSTVGKNPDAIHTPHVLNNHPNLHIPSGQENHTPVPLMECAPRPTMALLSNIHPPTIPYKPHKPPASSRQPQPTPTPRGDHHRPPSTVPVFSSSIPKTSKSTN